MIFLPFNQLVQLFVFLIQYYAFCHRNFGKMFMKVLIMEVFLIYIVDAKERWVNMFIATFVAGTLIYLVIKDSSLLSSINSFSQGVISHLPFNHPWLNHTITFILAHLLLNLYAVLLWFILWGFKHKLIALWALVTYFGTSLLGLLINQLLLIVTDNTTAPIDLTFLKLVVLMACIYICVLPNTSRFVGYLTIILLLILFSLRTLAGIQLHTVALINVGISILCGYVGIQLFEYIYLHWFNKLQLIRAFRHSDFN